MDILPMTPGHCLVIPKTHVRDIFELNDDTAAHIMQTCCTVANIIRQRLEPLGVNLVNNNGAAADQSQFHFHMHLIPRYGRDRLLHPRGGGLALSIVRHLVRLPDGPSPALR